MLQRLAIELHFATWWRFTLVEYSRKRFVTIDDQSIQRIKAHAIVTRFYYPLVLNFAIDNLLVRFFLSKYQTSYKNIFKLFIDSPFFPQSTNKTPLAFHLQLFWCISSESLDQSSSTDTSLGILCCYTGLRISYWRSHDSCWSAGCSFRTSLGKNERISRCTSYPVDCNPLARSRVVFCSVPRLSGRIRSGRKDRWLPIQSTPHRRESIRGSDPMKSDLGRIYSYDVQVCTVGQWFRNSRAFLLQRSNLILVEKKISQKKKYKEDLTKKVKKKKQFDKKIRYILIRRRCFFLIRRNSQTFTLGINELF